MMLGKDYMLAIVIVNYEGRCVRVCRSRPETKQEFGESVCAHVIFPCTGVDVCPASSTMGRSC